MTLHSIRWPKRGARLELGRTCSTVRQGYAFERSHVTRDAPHFLREIALSRQTAAAYWLRPSQVQAANIEQSTPFFRRPLQAGQAAMARLNTQTSATPQTRASTVDSLYRDPSVAPRRSSNARGSTYSVLSPSQSSDKENMDDQSRESTPQPAKRKGLSNASGRIPTPDTGSTTSSAGNKRRRTNNYILNNTSGVYEDEDEEDEENEEDEEEEEQDGPSRRRETTTQPEEDEDSQSKLYNPNQDPEKRRQVRYQLRDHHRQLEGEKRKAFLSA